MLKQKKISMLVHNSIEADTRVRKEARTLGRHGLDVNLIGYGKKSSGRFDGVPFIIVEKSILVDFRNFVIKHRKLVFAIICLFPVMVLGYFYNSKIYLISLLSMLLPVGVIYYFKASIIKLVKQFYQRNGYEIIANALLLELKKQQPDIIHAHDVIALMAGVKYKKYNRNVKLIWDAHELYTELSYKSPDQAAFVDRVIRSNSGFVDFFIVINNSFVEFYSKNYPKLPDPLVIMNATRKNNEFECGENKIRTAANISLDQKILLFQGGLSSGRGIKVLLEAVEQLPKAWSIVFMGKGALEEDILRLSKLYNKSRPAGRPAIALIPPAPYDELARWTSDATLGAIPYENTSLNHLYCTPNKLWEYPNAGVPIIASGMVEMKKMIETHGIGIVMPTDFTAQDIADALALMTEVRLNELKENCSKFNFIENWEKYEPQLLSMYEEITS